MELAVSDNDNGFADLTVPRGLEYDPGTRTALVLVPDPARIEHTSDGCLRVYMSHASLARVLLCWVSCPMQG